jgi:NitT/TauT family transport system ATP-binding protein
MIELHGVSKSFTARGKTTRALDPVDLSVTEQEFVALLGPSGCGKSTVLNMVAGLLPPTTGSVTYHGAPVAGPNGKVGYMTQKDTLLPWRTVADNVGIALELNCRAVAPGERRERVAQVLELVGLTGFEHHFPAELSGGMRKRAALARMLVYEPETLLLDEPFGALDAQLKIVMHQELLRLTRLRGMTVLFVTHDLSEAIALADRVVVFTGRPGRIRSSHAVPFGRERDVLTVQFEPAFAALYQELWAELKPDLETPEPRA